jgi:hypothetical protein
VKDRIEQKLAYVYLEHELATLEARAEVLDFPSIRPKTVIDAELIHLNPRKLGGTDSLERPVSPNRGPSLS